MHKITNDLVTFNPEVWMKRRDACAAVDGGLRTEHAQHVHVVRSLLAAKLYAHCTRNLAPRHCSLYVSLYVSLYTTL